MFGDQRGVLVGRCGVTGFDDGRQPPVGHPGGHDQGPRLELARSFEPHDANRAAGLVRQLLAFSRQQTLRPQVLQLGDVVSELSILLGRLLNENIELTLDQSSELWPVSSP